MNKWHCYAPIQYVALVVQSMDNTIHQVNHNLVDIVQFVLTTLIDWVVINLVDNVIQPSNNRNLVDTVDHVISGELLHSTILQFAASNLLLEGEFEILLQSIDHIVITLTDP